MSTLRPGPHFARLRYASARLMKRNAELSDVATSTSVVCPAHAIDSPPAIFLPGQLEKVIDSPFGMKEKAISDALGGRREWNATVRYEIRDAVLLDGSLYAGRGRHFLRDHLVVTGTKEVRQYKEATLVSSLQGCHYFGHWLRDDCSTYLLGEEGAPTLAVDTPGWRDKGVYSDYFGQSWSPVRRARIDRVTWYADLSHNRDKARRYRRLRDRVRRQVAPTNAGGIVYLKRGKSGEPRRLANEGEILACLKQCGVTVLEMEQTPVKQIIATLLDARLIISVEGSQLCHAVYTVADNGGILVIQPPTRFFSAHKDWADALGVQYGMIVGDPAGDGFSVDPGNLMRTIELMEAARSRCAEM